MRKVGSGTTFCNEMCDRQTYSINTNFVTFLSTPLDGGHLLFPVVSWWMWMIILHTHTHTHTHTCGCFRMRTFNFLISSCNLIFFTVGLHNFFACRFVFMPICLSTHTGCCAYQSTLNALAYVLTSKLMCVHLHFCTFVILNLHFHSLAPLCTTDILIPVPVQ